VVGPRRTSQRWWRYGFSARNIEKEICEGRDHKGGV